MLSQFDVERVVKRILGTVQAPIAALKHGVIQSDGHRVLNFQGGGVTVTDDPPNRRTNISISGASGQTGVTTTMLSSTAAKMLSLWNGTGNNAPPASWTTVGFNDTAWANAVSATDHGNDIIAGSTPIWLNATLQHANEQQLCRQTFTLPVGTVSTATLQIMIDEYTSPPATNTGISINGTVIGGCPNGRGGITTISVPLGLLTPNGSNVLAVWADGGALTDGWIAYKLTVVQIGGSTTVTNSLAADVTMTNANQFYDGPSVVVGPGNWLLVGQVVTTDTGGTSTASAKLWDGTTNFASSGSGILASSYVTLPVSAFVTTTAASTTFKISVANTSAGRAIKAALPNNAAGNTASTLTAVSV